MAVWTMALLQELSPPPPPPPYPEVLGCTADVSAR